MLPFISYRKHTYDVHTTSSQVSSTPLFIYSGTPTLVVLGPTPFDSQFKEVV